MKLSGRIGIAASVVALVAVALPLLAAAGSARSRSGRVGPSPASVLVVVSCPAVSQCTAANEVGDEVTFNPRAPGRTWRHKVDTNPVTLSCPSKSLCVAVADNQVSRRATALRPRSGRILHHWRLEHTLPLSVACVSTAQCTAVGDSGREVTFNPTGSALISNARVVGGLGMTEVTCPSRHQCTGIFGQGGAVVTFDPISGTTANPNGTLLSLYQFLGLSCPSTTQCTAVGYTGEEMTFDPVTAQLNAAGVVTLDSGLDLYGVSCPALNQCTAVDSRRHEVTFDPSSGTVNAAGVKNTGTGKSGSRVDCPTVHQCTVVGGNGKEATFDPTSPGVIVAHSLHP